MLIVVILTLLAAISFVGLVISFIVVMAESGKVAVNALGISILCFVLFSVSAYCDVVQTVHYVMHNSH